MKISIEHHQGKRPSFDVHLASGDGKDPFLTIRGCCIVAGSKGDFVSWPARKMESGKWWNHVRSSDQFSAAVIAEANKARKPAAKPVREDEGPPF